MNTQDAKDSGWKWGQEIDEPAYAEWQGRLAASRHALEALPDTWLAARRNFRTRLCASAEQYTASLGTGARKARDASAPIIITGHQPVVYHLGLLRKLAATERFAHEQQGTALHVIIDTDEGDSGAVVYPEQHGERLIKATLSLTEGGSTFRSQRLRSAPEIEAAFETMRRSLQQLSLPISGLTAAQAVWKDEAGRCAVRTQSVVRRKVSAINEHLEVPLSLLLGAAEFWETVGLIVGEPASFTARYNALLKEFRTAHGIKNPANPFPNMRELDDRVELPLWWLEPDGSRVAVFADSTSGRLYSPDNRLEQYGVADLAEVAGKCGERIVAPRAFLITAALRLGAADVFVHGRGGAKYDQFLDLFIARTLQTEPPAYVVASATRYLFAQEAERVLHARDLRPRMREIAFQVEKHLDSLELPVESREQIRVWGAARRALRERLALDKSAGQNVGELTREIKVLDQQIRTGLEPAFAEMLRWSEHPDSDVFLTREFPYFFFL